MLVRHAWGSAVLRVLRRRRATMSHQRLHRLRMLVTAEVITLRPTKKDQLQLLPTPQIKVIAAEMKAARRTR